MDEIAAALRITAHELGWNSTRLAAEVGRSEAAARSWLDAEYAINGPDLLKLMKSMPGLAKRLLPCTCKAVA